MRSSFIALCIITLTLGLTACTLTPPEKPISPLQTLSQESTITLDGEIYPFSVSISTRATHRLANIDGKLIAYLYSDIVNLQQFESQVVEIDGYWRKEKMQEIFFVEAIRLQNNDATQDIETPTESRFTTQNFTFVYPYSWEYSLSPDGIAYFTEKNDSQRKTFLTFSVEAKTKKDENIQPNISIAGLSGVRTITPSEASDREHQQIQLFSKTTPINKYTFSFSGNNIQQKEFLLLINSFIEGQEQVAQVIAHEKRAQAEREASKLLAQTPDQSETQTEDSSIESEEDSELENNNNTEPSETGNTQDQPSNVLDLAAKYASERKEETPQTTNNTDLLTQPETSQSSENITLDPDLFTNDFKNIIDDRAFSYGSSYYNINLQVPYGFWFRNFGPQDAKLFRIGFADQEIQNENDVDFFLESIASQNPEKTVSEKLSGETLTITFPRNNNSYFQFIGPVTYRDAMRSILLTIE